MKNTIKNITCQIMLASFFMATAVRAHATTFTVNARSNSSSGGVGLNTGISLSPGDTFTVTVDPKDLWSAGDLPRWSNADGLVRDLFATGADESGQPAGTKIGAVFGLWTQFGFSAPYGALIGELSGTFFLLGTSFSGSALAGGTLRLFYWDENNGDNFQSVEADIRVGCGDDRDTIIQQYKTFKVIDRITNKLFTPTCDDFTQTAHSVFFTFDELTVKADFDWALLRSPLLAPKSSGHGLDKWRMEFGASRIINSAYRNPKHNFATPGAAPKSRHMFGDAVDLRNQTGKRKEWDQMIQAAMRAGADWIEPDNGPCGLACAHADWRNTPGSYLP